MEVIELNEFNKFLVYILGKLKEKVVDFLIIIPTA